LLSYGELRRFRRLGDGKDGPDKASRIAKFAARFGPLGVPTPTDFHETPNFERVSDWRLWARTMDAIVRICLRDPLPREEDYEHLRRAFRDRGLFPQNPRVRGLPRQGFVESWAATRDAGRCLAMWLATAQVHTDFSWHENEPAPSWRIISTGLLAATALGTVEVLRDNVTDEARLRGDRVPTSCWHCKVIYIPRRKPSAGRRRFCPECQELKMPEKYRDSDKAKRRLEERKRRRRKIRDIRPGIPKSTSPVKGSTKR
jgi:hypothetical protein